MTEHAHIGPHGSPASTGARRVLVADDDHDTADSLAMLLGLLGVEACVAYGGEDALARYDSCAPDLAILDLGMPGLDGFQLARAIRARPGGQRITLVALSGWAQAADRERALASAFDRHVAKPLSLDQLRELLALAPRRATP